MSAIKTVGELKAFLAAIPDHIPVALKDPNFTGAYNDRIEINQVEGYWARIPGDQSVTRAVLIDFPFETPCEE